MYLRICGPNLHVRVYMFKQIGTLRLRVGVHIYIYVYIFTHMHTAIT